MKTKYSHNKLKNTGILFELLIRQITSDILNNADNVFAEQLIKKHFSKKTELAKELSLFQSLIYDKFSKIKLSEELILVVLNKRKNLNESKLKADKYNLIKDLRENFNIDEFMKSRINNYTLMSSIQTLFDDAINKTVPPKLVVKSKHTILEHVQQKKIVTQQDESIDNFNKLDNDVKILSMRLLMEKFNKKYSKLTDKQQEILKLFIGNTSNNATLKLRINKEFTAIQEQLLTFKRKTDDRIQVKLERVIDKLEMLKEGQISKNTDIEILLRTHSLLDSLKNIK